MAQIYMDVTGGDMGFAILVDCAIRKCALEMSPELSRRDTLLVQLLEKMIQKGADVNSTDDSRKTPLMTAAEHGLCEVVELLLDHGADVDAKDENGFTALYYAVSREDARTAMAFLLHKADPSLVQDAGDFRAALAELLCRDGKELNEKIQKLTDAGCLETVLWLTRDL